MGEDHVLEPTNPYAATKAAAEFLVKSYHRSFGLPVIITRGNNVYGPHQFPEKLIPKFTNQLARGRAVTLHGTGENTRNFLFVEDVARAFDCILHKAEIGKVYNIGGSNEQSNLAVAKQLIKIMGLEDQEASLISFVLTARSTTCGTRSTTPRSRRSAGRSSCPGRRASSAPWSGTNPPPSATRTSSRPSSRTRGSSPRCRQSRSSFLSSPPGVVVIKSL